MPAYPADEIYFELTADIIGGAIEVHREFGPGLMESIYEKSLMHELHLRGHKTRTQSRVPITYKGYTFEEELRTDIIVDDLVIVENKAIETILPVHKAQLLSYMKLLKIQIGLLINYKETKLTNGISRLTLRPQT